MSGIDIQDLLVWAYRDQAVDEAPRHWDGPCVALMRWDVAVDGVGVEAVIDPDAFLVHAAVMGLSRYQIALVIGCAKWGSVPDWYPGARPVMAAVLNGRGSPAAIYDRSRNVVGHRVRPALELADGSVMVGYSSADLTRLRMGYMVWHEALCALASSLSQSMPGRDITGPRVMREPWAEKTSEVVKAA